MYAHRYFLSLVIEKAALHCLCTDWCRSFLKKVLLFQGSLMSFERFRACTSTRTFKISGSIALLVLYKKCNSQRVVSRQNIALVLRPRLPLAHSFYVISFIRIALTAVIHTVHITIHSEVMHSLVY